MRLLITGVSRLTVRTLFGAGVHDVNSPYRLIRGTSSRPSSRMPGEPFAPNVILSGLAVRAGLRIGEWPVPCGQRQGGTGSLNLRRLVQEAARSFSETVIAGLRG